MEKLFQVTDVRKRLTLTPTNRFKTVYEVVFETRAGVMDNIEIDEADYTPENIKDRLTELALKHEAIIGLGE